MSPTFFKIQQSLLLTVLICSNCFGADEALVVFQDDFADVKGATLTNDNGSVTNSDQAPSRSTYTFISDFTSGGKITLSVTEDQKSNGPDDKPGVLAMSYVSVPSSADYSGFVYSGKTQKPIQVAALKETATDADLKRVKLSFRYKAVHTQKENVGAVFNCRFEPEVEEAYEYRVDFGQLKATEKWQTFEKTLSEADNRDAFLGALKNNSTNAFKLVFAQDGEMSDYQSGDTLLLDDMKITVSNK